MLNIIQYVEVGLLLSHITAHGLWLHRTPLSVEAVRHHHHVSQALRGLWVLHPVLQLRLMLRLVVVLH